jgi:hypothetical protein
MARSGESLGGVLAVDMFSKAAAPTNACNMLVNVLIVKVCTSRLLTFDALRPREELPL